MEFIRKKLRSDEVATYSNPTPEEPLGAMHIRRKNKRETDNEFSIW